MPLRRPLPALMSVQICVMIYVRAFEYCITIVMQKVKWMKIIGIYVAQSTISCDENENKLYIQSKCRYDLQQIKRSVALTKH